VVSLAALGTVELGGKRGARLLAARARASVAESRLVLAGFDVAREVRIATAAVAAAAEATEENRAELVALQRVAGLERQRYAEAAISSSELARTASEVQDARAALAETERALLSARAALAGALAVPVAAVEDLEPRPGATAGCARLDSVSLDSLAVSALHRRGEVTTALAGYAVAEAEMRLEAARRHPDLEIGPGFIWDQGVHRWTLALALPSLLGFRNRGPLAEAEAAREVAALRVTEAQDSVIAEVGAAGEACRGSRLALAAADSQVAAARGVVARARGAYERGETGSLEPARAELQLVRAGGIRRAAARRVTMAGLDLEAAAGDWHDGDRRPWPDSRQDPRQENQPR
jgi:outer membrane protein TolC